MAESEQRNLNIWVGTRLSRMEPFLLKPTSEEMAQEIAEKEIALKNELKPTIELQIKNIKWRLGNEHRKLAKMKEKEIFALRVLQWYSHEILDPANLPSPPPGLNVLYLEAKQEIEAYGKLAQEMQQLKMNLLETEIRTWEQFLENTLSSTLPPSDVSSVL
jgi:dynactin complex subunit